MQPPRLITMNTTHTSVCLIKCSVHVVPVVLQEWLGQLWGAQQGQHWALHQPTGQVHAEGCWCWEGHCSACTPGLGEGGADSVDVLDVCSSSSSSNKICMGLDHWHMLPLGHMSALQQKSPVTTIVPGTNQGTW